MNNSQIDEFFGSLKGLFSFRGHSHEEQCKQWEKVLSGLDEGDKSPEEELPILLSLVYPEFYRDWRGVDIGDKLKPSHATRQFKKNLYTGNCEIGKLVTGVECPFWKNGESLSGDHLWPHSLGGATCKENLLRLCKDCNTQKSSSPLLFPGHSVPEWLIIRVSQLRDLKMKK